MPAGMNFDLKFPAGWFPGGMQVFGPSVGSMGGFDLGNIGAMLGAGELDRRDVKWNAGGVPQFPMGSRNPVKVPIIKPVPSVPKVRQPIRTGDITLPSKANGAIGPPFKISIPSPSSPLPPQILTPSEHLLKPIPKVKGPLDVLTDIIQPKKVQPVANDLGNLLLTGAGIYRDIQMSKNTQPVYYDTQGLNPLSDVPLFNWDSSNAAGSAAVGAAMAPGTCLPPGYKYDKCGNVVKTRRRRRRRLATSSDIKDLAALTAVTNPAEKKTWIATHPS